MAGPTGNESLSFWANVLDGQNRETLTIGVDTETGLAIRLTFRDRDSLETLAVAHVPLGAANSVGQALMLASAMKASEIQNRLMGE